MKNLYLAAVITITCLLGIGISARAQDSDGVVVNVPFDFVVGTKTLPADTYSIGRVSPSTNSNLLIRSFSNGTFVLPINLQSAPGGAPKLSFEQVGGKYVLTQIETPDRVYEISASPEMIKLGQVRDSGKSPSAGGN